MRRPCMDTSTPFAGLGCVEFFEHVTDQSFDLNRLAGQVGNLAFELRGLKLALAYPPLHSRELIFKRVVCFFCALAGESKARNHVREPALQVVDVFLPLALQLSDHKRQGVGLALAKSLVEERRRRLSRSGAPLCISGVILESEPRFTVSAHSLARLRLSVRHPFAVLLKHAVLLGVKRGEGAVEFVVVHRRHQVAPLSQASCGARSPQLQRSRQRKPRLSAW